MMKELMLLTPVMRYKMVKDDIYRGDYIESEVNPIVGLWVAFDRITSVFFYALLLYSNPVSAVSDDSEYYY